MISARLVRRKSVILGPVLHAFTMWRRLAWTEGEQDETGEDAEHAEDLAPGVVLPKENQSVGEADDGTTAADGAHDCYHRVRVAQRQHIDVVGDDQKERDEENERWKVKSENYALCVMNYELIFLAAKVRLSEQNTK